MSALDTIRLNLKEEIEKGWSGKTSKRRSVKDIIESKSKDIPKQF